MDEKVDKSRITKIISALIKKAVGYDDKEVIEEYQVEGEKVKLIKKKVTTKSVPPDLSASKLLLEYFNGDVDDGIENMTEQQMDAEADRLYSEYQKIKSESVMQGLPPREEIEKLRSENGDS